MTGRTVRARQISIATDVQSPGVSLVADAFPADLDLGRLGFLGGGGSGTRRRRILSILRAIHRGILYVTLGGLVVV